jgi:heme-degrading monooxygenase HmoA
MILRAKGDSRKLEQYSNEHPDLLKSIVARAKENGLIRHRFFGTADEVIVVDEWPDAASFQKFFASSPDIQEMMASIGITEPPDITFADQLSVDDSFG